MKFVSKIFLCFLNLNLFCLLISANNISKANNICPDTLSNNLENLEAKKNLGSKTKFFLKNHKKKIILGAVTALWLIYGHERLRVFTKDINNIPASGLFQKNKIKDFKLVPKSRKLVGAALFPVYDILSGIEKTGNFISKKLKINILKPINKNISISKSFVQKFIWSKILGLSVLKKWDGFSELFEKWD